MKISLLTPNFSSNCVGRAFILAAVLGRRHEVEIVGPAFDGSVWPPLARVDLPLKPLAVGSGALQIPRLRRLIGRIEGDVLYATKPLATSFGIGLWKRWASRKPLVLDIDDWDAGFVRGALRGLPQWRRLRYLAGSALRPHLVHSYWNNVLFERLTGRADAVTVSNRFLEGRFGGTLVWHGRDTAIFRPGRFERSAARRALGFPQYAPLAIFLGTPHPYKGIEDLIEAAGSLADRDLHLALVGIGNDGYGGRIRSLARERLGERALCHGPQTFDDVPRFLSAADLAVIPQRRTEATRGQLPAKLFDAMALQVPVVSTAVSDIPEILEDCGWVVEPGSARELAAAMRSAVERPDEARARAERARRRCEERYSWDAMETALAAVFDRFG